MPLKDKFNANPPLAIGVVAALFVVAGTVAWFSLRGERAPGTSSEAYFTVDDGVTYFVDDVARLPPFDHAGKQAVRAYVFACGDKKFVNHLERYTADGKKSIEDARAAMQSGKAPTRGWAAGGTFTEVKRPGGKEWIASSDHVKAGPIMSAKCPDGSGGEIRPVEP